ncbi:serine-threonine protein kinase, putative [Entamoeba invadens IP1]|uniref:Serine-threonine protein kinase, putative n=1 Tax=Entamoeba invadens IP1 TaxID=370355 RepID=A0A0A1U8U9_ENTIV|nr:serine-threonine protein kinase, putative [Entamoeba invadens IP1]ELP91272.1 serine-threonine protein kinase, putative [Entamoeba invadens IP1]|eukprot:XP_004258043.1 serine-threonine protein kinase, putative [Entamoeba invadens IP1]
MDDFDFDPVGSESMVQASVDVLEERLVLKTPFFLSLKLFGGKLIPVMQETTEQLCVNNKTTHSICVEGKNVDTPTFSLSFYPKKLQICPNSQKFFAVILHPTCCTHINTKISIYVDASIYCEFDVSFKTQPSLWVNPEFVSGLSAEKVIGRGVSSVVFEGMYNSQKIAIKRVVGSPQLVAKELELLVNLRNPYLVQCFGMSYFEGSVHFLLELAPYGGFDTKMKIMSYELKMKVLLDVLKAIQFLHKNNVIHRDIKPANVVLFNYKKFIDINAKLADLGSATIYDENVGMTHIVGTVCYMAPEIMSGGNYGFECDTYSFGMMLYESISQREFFCGMSKVEIIKFVQEGNRPKKTSAIPSQVFSIIENCWNQNPKERLSIEQLIIQINKIRNPSNEIITSHPIIEKHGCVLSGLSPSISIHTICNSFLQDLGKKDTDDGVYYVATKLYRNGNYQQAIEVLQKRGSKTHLPSKKLLSKLLIRSGQIEEGVDLLIDCSQTDVQSQLKLIALINGGFVLTDKQKLSVLETLSSQENKEATFALAMKCMYESPKNLLKSERLLRRLMVDHYPQADLHLGIVLYMMQQDSESSKTALQLFQSSSVSGNMDGTNNCGVLYALGATGKIEMKTAMTFFEKAAIGGCGAAENNRGVLLFNGETGEKDYVSAVECFKRSGMMGSKEGMYNLAVCYFNGDGVPMNNVEGVTYLKQSAALGDSEAQCLLASCYEYGKGVSVDKQLSRYWTQTSATNGSSVGMFNVGCWYQVGDGVAQDSNTAFKWFKKSAKAGGVSGMCSLGKCYFCGEGVKEDKSKGVKWFLKASENGNGTAMYNLANCYYYGDGVEKSISSALQWSEKGMGVGYIKAELMFGKCLLRYYQFELSVNVFEDVISDGLVEGEYLLGECYLHGCGLKKDLFKALQCFEKCGEKGRCVSTRESWDTSLQFR